MLLYKLLRCQGEPPTDWGDSDWQKSFGLLIRFCFAIVLPCISLLGGYELHIAQAQSTNAVEPMFDQQVGEHVTLPPSVLTESAAENGINADTTEIALKKASSLGGAFGAFEVRPPYVYVGRGHGLEVIDFSDQGQPVRVGSIALEGQVSTIEIQDEIAYLTLDSNQIITLDISDATQPRLLDSFQLPTTYENQINGFSRYIYAIQNMVIVDKTIYAAASAGGLFVIDAADPEQLFEINRYAFTSSFLFGLAVSVTVVDNYAYVIYSRYPEMDLRIFDVTNPSEIVPQGVYSFSRDDAIGWTQLIVENGMAYYSLGLTLYVVDATDTLQPFLAGTYSSPQIENYLSLHAVEEGQALVSGIDYEVAGDFSTRLELLDVSSLSTPQLLSGHNFTGTVRIVGTTMVDDSLYVNTDYSDKAMYIFDSALSNEEVQVQRVADVSPNVEVVGDQIYDVSPSGVRLIDFADPANPSVVGTYAPNSYAAMVKIHKGLVYNFYLSNLLGQGPKIDLEVVEYANGDVPSIVGAYTLSGRDSQWRYGEPNLLWNSIAFDDDRLFISMQDGSVHIIDISTPSEIELIHTLTGPQTAAGLTVDGDLLYIADLSIGLHIMDIRDSLNPVLLATYNTPDTAHHVQIIDNLAYVADGQSGIHVVDVSDPSAPVWRTNIQTEDGARELHVDGRKIFAVPAIASNYMLLQIIDLDDPDSIRWADGIWINTNASIVVADERVYMLKHRDGVKVYNVQDIRRPRLIGEYRLPVDISSPSIAVDQNQIFVAAQSAGIQILEETALSFVHLPVLVRTFNFSGLPPGQYIFNNVSVYNCQPQRGGTWVHGRVRLNGSPVDGVNAVFSYEPDGPPIASVPVGPHFGYLGWSTGEYGHIIDAEGPREGDWYFWLTDESLRRISEIAYWHSDGPDVEGGCSQVRIDFDSTKDE